MGTNCSLIFFRHMADLTATSRCSAMDLDPTRECAHKNVMYNRNTADLDKSTSTDLPTTPIFRRKARGDQSCRKLGKLFNFLVANNVVSLSTDADHH